MLIKKVRLEHFKKFNSLEKEFGPGINVVKGPLNESGKSTLLEGILTALFQDPKSKAKNLDQFDSWGKDIKPRLHIEFEVNGEDYALAKDFNKKTVCLTARGSQEQWDVPRKIEEKLRSLLGAASSDLFEVTCCIKQDEVRDIQSGREQVSHSMERIITGGSYGATAADAIEKLQDRIKKMQKGLKQPAKSPGPIAALSKRIDELEQKLRESRQDVEEVEKLRKELPEVEKRLAEVTRELDTCQKLVENNKKLQQIEENIGRLKEKCDSIDGPIAELNSLEKEKQDLESRRRSLFGFDDQKKVTDAEEELSTLQVQRRDIEQDLSERKQELAEVEARLRRRAVIRSLASRAVLAAGIAIAILGFALMAWHNWTAAAGGLGIALVIASLMARNSLAGIEGEREHLLKRIGEMERAVSEKEQREKQILSTMNCASQSEFFQKYNEFKYLTEQLNTCETKRATLLKGRSLEELEQQRRQLIRDIAVEEEKLTEELKSTRLSPEDFVKLQERIEKLGSDKQKLERRKLEIEVGLKQARCDPEDLNQLEEELQELRDKLEAEKKMLEVFELTRDFISTAREETLQDVHADLQHKIEGYFSIFTNGKYGKVQLEPNNLECSVFSEEKGDWVQPEELSGGTIDQFYLAFRLALAQLIYRDRLPPLIFDDPFYNFDVVRLSRALASLKELSKKQQVIIFTLGDTYDSIADRIIELPQD